MTGLRLLTRKSIGWLTKRTFHVVAENTAHRVQISILHLLNSSLAEVRLMIVARSSEKQVSGPALPETFER